MNPGLPDLRTSHQPCRRDSDRPIIDHTVIAGIVVAGTSVLALSCVVGLDIALLAAAALTAGTASVAAAYRIPMGMLVAGVLAGQVLGQDAQLLLPSGWRSPQVGALQVRYYDIFLLGISGATALRALLHPRRIRRFAISNPAMILLLGWLAAQVTIGAVKYDPIRALGELRTHYHYLILVPYIVMSFASQTRQVMLFKTLAGTGVLFLPLAVVLGWAQFGLAIGPSTRWLSASANLASLFGLVAIVAGQRYGSFRSPRWLVWLATLAFLVVTLLNGHRSVWLAALVTLVALVSLRVLPIARQLALTIAAAGGLMAAAVFYPGGSGALFDYVVQRATAFTDYSEDATAAWRYTLWTQALEDIRAAPLAGVGFGQGFSFLDPSGEVVTTYPHNMYLTLVYHSGAIGMALYIAFIVGAFSRFFRRRHTSHVATQAAVISTAVVALAAAHTYYVAYSFDYFTWLFTGLAVASTLPADRTEEETRLGA